MQLLINITQPLLNITQSLLKIIENHATSPEKYRNISLMTLFTQSLNTPYYRFQHNLYLLSKYPLYLPLSTPLNIISTPALNFLSKSLKVYKFVSFTKWRPTNPPTNNVKARDPVGSKNPNQKFRRFKMIPLEVKNHVLKYLRRLKMHF